MDTPPDRKHSVGRDTAALWRAFIATRDVSLRDRLIAAYAPMVAHAIARSQSRAAIGDAMDDCIRVGLAAVMDVVDKHPSDAADTLDGAMWYAVRRAVRRHAAGTTQRLEVHPEAGPEKLAELRARVRRRQYRVDCRGVADAMLRRLGDSARGRRPARTGPTVAGRRRGGRDHP